MLLKYTLTICGLALFACAVFAHFRKKAGYPVPPRRVIILALSGAMFLYFSSIIEPLEMPQYSDAQINATVNGTAVTGVVAGNAAGGSPAQVNATAGAPGK